MEHNGTILIVDDSRVEQEIAGALLANHRYNLAFASSGTEALTKATELTPDVILLDVMMPGMDGFEVCRRLRSDSVLAEVPIIMITALDDRDSRLRGIEAGADSFVSKPYDQVELLAHIRTITRINRYHQLLAANRQLEEKIGQLSALYGISRSLNHISDIDELLSFILGRTKELLGVEGVSIMFYDHEKDELYFPIAATEKERVGKWLKRIRFPSNFGVAGYVFHENRSTIVPDVNLDDRFYREVDDITGFATKSVMCVPLQSNNRVLGIIEAVNKKDGEFVQEHQRLLEGVAGDMAISIEKANLYQDLQKAEAKLRRQNAVLRQSVSQKYSFGSIIGISSKMMDMVKKAKQVALTDSTVLIYGETGSGKELLAQAIHYSSPRAPENFVPINCGAIPENLLESELFGHERGAFTSAISQRIGRFEEANGGTLLLDEIGDMPLDLQVRLLRVLQEGAIQRLGSNQEIHVDVRVIAATHGDLMKLVADGRFRQDLYYRLKVVELDIPPLRERKRDIPLLVSHFIRYYSEKLGKEIEDIDDAALDLLCRHHYPGNIRELQHIVESAAILCRDRTITVDVLPKETQTLATQENAVTPFIADPITIPRNNAELKTAKAEAQQKIELLFLTELLYNAKGNISEAAREAGMNRSWLTELIGKHGLDLRQF